ncbi:hypothetical protein BDW02DRAFT_336007 [Decorospora gaudefroyi]|uniref:Uncharacterized protein n=1 Tax=Decorospora gaudefroyi TaxID=184978 RepID=A0A6A5KRF7_9PLEO|nr:hypothetical protein BDW02DRAFT_336007 [Decorospora gaudefroyi]
MINLLQPHRHTSSFYKRMFCFTHHFPLTRPQSRYDRIHTIRQHHHCKQKPFFKGTANNPSVEKQHPKLNAQTYPHVPIIIRPDHPSYPPHPTANNLTPSSHHGISPNLLP